MGICFKEDTLAYQFGVRPNVIRQDLSSLRVPLVVKHLNTLLETQQINTWAGLECTFKTKGKPEVDALVFYLTNHTMSLLRSQYSEVAPLGADLKAVNFYHKVLALLSTRMFNYLLLICTRESRHVHQDYDTALWSQITAQFGEETANFHKKIRGASSEGAASRLRDSPPDLSLGNYTKFLSYVFHEGKYSSGYGGKAWGAVADVLAGYVSGKLSAELMMDTAFTLCHNNGPIFNKGMLFDHYTDEIKVILDVQRSGQIPEMVLNAEHTFVGSTLLVEAWTTCKDILLRHGVGTYVDWMKVEALGSMQKYPSKIENQIKKHGHPAAKKTKPSEPKKAVPLEDFDDHLGYVWITPTVKVKKVKSPRKEGV